MNKYNSRLCCKHHSQGTFILIKFKEFIQKYWISITKLKQIDTYMSKQLTRIGGKVFGKYGSRSKCA